MGSSAALAICGEYAVKFTSLETGVPGQGRYESGLRDRPTDCERVVLSGGLILKSPARARPGPAVGARGHYDASYKYS